MGRISREVMFMMIARAASMRSTCMRRNVGAVITHDNRPISIGYNGAPSGLDHCGGNDCPGVVPGNCGTLHAERNAIDHLPPFFLIPPRIKRLTLYTTDAPCEDCCRRIIDSEVIKAVYFEKPYRDPRPLQLLWEGGIKVFEVSPSGYIIDYFSRRVTQEP